jgi:hypothetical protein
MKQNISLKPTKRLGKHMNEKCNTIMGSADEKKHKHHFETFI